VEDPGVDLPERALPEGDREVQLLALVVDDVRGPARVDLVAEAVRAIVEEVDAEEARDPRPGPLRRDREEAEMLVERDVGGEESRLEENADELVEDPAGEVAQRVGQAVDVPLEEPRGHEFDGDEQEEDGDGEVDEVHLGPAIHPNPAPD